MHQDSRYLSYEQQLVALGDDIATAALVAPAGEHSSEALATIKGEILL